MTLKKPKISHIIYLVLIALLIWPRTRQPIQVFLHKGLALFSPSEISVNKRERLTDFSWKLQSLDGETYQFENAQGKVVLLNFWATWCPPCIAEMPSFQSLYEDYGDKVEFILVSNESAAKVKKFLDSKGFTMNSFRPLIAYPEQLETKSIPRTLIIDKKGHIVIDKTGAANWNSDSVRKTLDRLLAD